MLPDIADLTADVRLLHDVPPLLPVALDIAEQRLGQRPGLDAWVRELVEAHVWPRQREDMLSGRAPLWMQPHAEELFPTRLRASTERRCRGELRRWPGMCWMVWRSGWMYVRRKQHENVRGVLQFYPEANSHQVHAWAPHRWVADPRMRKLPLMAMPTITDVLARTPQEAA